MIDWVVLFDGDFVVGVDVDCEDFGFDVFGLVDDYWFDFVEDDVGFVCGVEFGIDVGVWVEFEWDYFGFCVVGVEVVGCCVDYCFLVIVD